MMVLQRSVMLEAAIRQLTASASANQLYKVEDNMPPKAPAKKKTAKAKKTTTATKARKATKKKAAKK